jgi:hypothetical protein
MPITGPSSYVPTIESFINHWTAVNAALPAAQPLVLPANGPDTPAPVALADLQSLYNALIAQRDVVQASIIDEALASETLIDQKRALLAKLNLFNDTIRGSYPGSKWERVLTGAPSIGDGRTLFIRAIESTRNIWSRFNTTSGLAAIVLAGGYDLAAFDADLSALRVAYVASGKEEDSLALEREERNDIQDRIYPILKRYRALMPTLFPVGAALVDELPQLTPTSSRTPDPVTATAVWDVATSKAKITWTASTDSELARYEVRWSPGLEYQVDAESTLGTISPGATLEFLTDQGLTTPGAKSNFRVVVVLTTGNEAGSEPVSVVRG